MNDDPHAGRFSLTFDDTGRLVKVGRTAVGSSTMNYPVFSLPTAGARGIGNAQLTTGRHFNEALATSRRRDQPQKK